MGSPYLVPVAQLLRDVPATLDVEFDAPFDERHEFEPRGPAESDVAPEATVHVALNLQSFIGGLWARGQIEAPWHGICRRCSMPVLGLVHVEVSERFVDERGPGDGETYLIDHDEMDLAPLIHDAVFLELPLAPLCREDCQGLCPYCGIDRNDASCTCEVPTDPRWATLDGLRFANDDVDESNDV